MTKYARMAAFLSEYLPWINEQLSTGRNIQGDPIFAMYLSNVLSEMKVKHSVHAVVFSSFNMRDTNLEDLANTGFNYYWNNKLYLMVEVDGHLFDADGHLKESPDMPGVSKVIEIPEYILIQNVDSEKWETLMEKRNLPLLMKLIKKIPKRFFEWNYGQFEIDNTRKKELPNYMRNHSNTSKSLEEVFN